MTYVIPEVHRYAARGGSSQGPRQLAPNIGEDRMCSFYLNGGAENASTGKRKYTEKASTKQRISQGWKTHVGLQKTQVRKMQVQCKPNSVT